MNGEDYAIIVGVQEYPGIDDPANGQPSLSGTENDARAFRDWLVSPEGGAVPADHVDMILSSAYQRPFENIFDARPAAKDVQDAFRKLQTQSKKNATATGFTRVGRRLYIFMSGHGIAPNQGGGKNDKEAALLMADVELTNVSSAYHILGAYTANWFCLNECFDEIFLFMDCCREEAFVTGLNEFLSRTGTSDNAKRYYAFATKWSRLSRERPMPDEDNTVRGVFTKTLLLGLAGAAADPDPANPTQGVVTGASLKSYLYNNMSEFLDPELRTEFSAKWEPEVVCLPDSAQPGNDILIKRVLLQTFPVTVHLPAGTTGELSILRNMQFPPIFSKPVGAAPVDLFVELSRGQYVAFVTINGNSQFKPFGVKGIEGLAGKGGVDVTF